MSDNFWESPSFAALINNQPMDGDDFWGDAPRLDTSPYLGENPELVYSRNWPDFAPAAPVHAGDDFWGDAPALPWPDETPAAPRAPMGPAVVAPPVAPQPPRVVSEPTSYQPFGIEGLPEVPADFPILGGFFKALAQANQPTVREGPAAHFSAPIRDVPVVGELSRGLEVASNVMEQAFQPVSGGIAHGIGLAASQAGLGPQIGIPETSAKAYSERVQGEVEAQGKTQDIVGAMNVAYEQAPEGVQIIASLLNPAYYLFGDLGLSRVLKGASAAAHVKDVGKLSAFERALLSVPAKVSELTPEQAFKRGAVPVLGRVGQVFRETPESAARGALVNMADNFGHKLNIVTEGVDAAQGLGNLDELVRAVKSGTVSRVLPLSQAAMKSKVGQQLTHALQGFDERAVLQKGAAALNLLRAPELHAMPVEQLAKGGAIFDPLVAALPKLREIMAASLDDVARGAAMQALHEEVAAHVLTATKASLYGQFLTHTGGYLSTRFPGVAYAAPKVVTKAGQAVVQAGATFAKAHPNRLENFMASAKSFQSAIVLGLNPYYVVRNFWNNYSTMAARGVLGYWDDARVAALMKEVGVNPMRFAQGFGISGEAGGFGLQKLAARIEAQSSRMAFASGIDKSLRQLMRRGKVWDFAPESVAALRQIDPTGRLERQAAQIIERFGTDRVAALRQLRTALGSPAQMPAYIDLDKVGQAFGAHLPNPRARDEMLSTYWGKVAPFFDNVKTPDDLAAARVRVEHWLREGLARAPRVREVQPGLKAAGASANAFGTAAEIEARNLRALLDAIEGAVDFTKPLARTRVPPALLADLERNIFPAINDVKLAAVKMGEWYRDAALLNYEKRYGWNAFIGMFFPYEFWMERSMVQWAEYFIDRPGMFALYAEMRDMLYNKLYNEDFPERLRGTVPVGLPFVPDWLGGSVGFFDPLNALLPLEQLAAPIKNLRYLVAGPHDVAVRLRQMAANGEITPEQAELAIKTQKGPLWDQARQSVSALDTNPFDIAGLVASPYVPWDWLWKIVTGRPDEIRGLLPIAPLVQGATAVAREMGAGAIPPGGVQIDPVAALKDKLFNAPYDPTENYRVDRALASLVAMGRLQDKDAHLAMIERKGPAYDQALQYAALEQAVPSLTGLTGFRGKVVSPGEVEIRGEQGQVNQLVDQLVRQAGANPEGMEYPEKKALLKETGLWDQVSQFYEAHPALGVNIEKGNEIEERLRDWYQNEIWKRYNAMGELDRRLWRDQHPDAAAQFIIKDTRVDINTIPLLTLAKWTYLLRGKVPQVPAGASVQPAPAFGQMGMEQYQFANPEDAAVYKEWLTRYTAVKDLSDAYYALPQGSAERKTFMAAHPELKEYYAWNETFWKEHPDLAKLIGREAQAPTTQAPARPSGGMGGGGGGYAPRPAASRVTRPPAVPVPSLWEQLQASLANDRELYEQIEGYLARVGADAELYAKGKSRLLAWLKAQNAAYLAALRDAYTRARVKPTRATGRKLFPVEVIYRREF